MKQKDILIKQDMKYLLDNRLFCLYFFLNGCISCCIFVFCFDGSGYIRSWLCLFLFFRYYLFCLTLTLLSVLLFFALTYDCFYFFTQIYVLFWLFNHCWQSLKKLNFASVCFFFACFGYLEKENINFESLDCISASSAQNQ